MCIRDRFHSLIKREWLNRFNIINFKHAYRLVFEYIETFYNTVRTVSYTHLDVYKRQWYSLISSYAKSMKSMKIILMFSKLLLRYAIYALSLIHIKMCIRDRSSPVTLSALLLLPVSFRHPTRYSAFPCWSLITIPPVSYTHLDVYKRQHYPLKVPVVPPEAASHTHAIWQYKNHTPQVPR